MNKKHIITLCLFILLTFLSFEAWAGELKSNSALTANKQGKVSKEIEKLRNLRRSQINISKNNFSVRIKVFLFAENEKVEILEGSYCGGEEGAKQYTGNYQLISVKDNKIESKIDLGKDYEFIEDTLHSGLQIFVMPQTYEQLIMIYQYRSCNAESVEFYRVDIDGRMYKVNFFDKDGTVRTIQSTIPARDIPQSDGSVIFCSYNNAVGYTFCDSYNYNAKDFIQTAISMTQEKTVDGEPRRILFEYISALSQEDYKRAVYYYGGSYDLLIKLNPDISPDDKPKLFERYCIKNGGKCLISEYPDFIDIKSSMQLKSGELEVSFKPENKPDFEFRVRRIGSEFKVIDLPPDTP